MRVRVVIGGTLALVLGLAGVLGVNAMRPGCPQPEAVRAPEIPVDAGQAAARLGEAVRFRTVSHLDRAQFDPQAFLRLHAFLQRAYPAAHRVLEREVVNGYSLLYAWPGTDPGRKPILLLGHLDVVPIEPGTETRWTHPPFSGRRAGGYLWGRGAMDDKASVLAALEAVELVAAQGFRPARTVYLAFGHDEELGGEQGAAKIAALLRSRGVTPEYLLDEGLGIVHGVIPGVARPVAIIGIAEKGWLNLELAVTGAGGHASMPPPSTAVGILSAAIHKLEANPMPAGLKGPVRELFICLAPEMPPPQRLLMSNLWLFEPLVRAQLARSPATNASIRTTAAATMVRGGNKENVLPADARAVVNVRILPGDDAARVTEHARRVVGDPRVSIRALGGMEPSALAPTDSPAYRALAATVRQVFPDALVAPGLMIGATDSRHYMTLTRAAYRFLPLRLTPEDATRFHGVNERIAVDNYADIIRFYVQLLRNAAQ